MRTLLAIVMIVAWGAATAALGQEAAEDRVTEINFDDDTITGDLQRPDGELVEARRRVQHTNLIRERETFRDRIMESVGDL